LSLTLRLVNFSKVTAQASQEQHLNIFYIKAYPFRAILLVTGLVLFIASVSTVPVFGAIGFGALGHGAGTAAAFWQVLLGLVEAGSLFAWCQNAAMGGAAIGGIQAVGATGMAIACTTWTSGVNMPGLKRGIYAFYSYQPSHRSSSWRGQRVTSQPDCCTPPRMPQL